MKKDAKKYNKPVKLKGYVEVNTSKQIKNKSTEDSLSNNKNNINNLETKTNIKEAENSKKQSQNWIKPCDGVLKSGFGRRTSPTPGASEYHNGWDIGVDVGTPIKAIRDGVIIAAGPAKGYGKWVVIDHGEINGVRVTSEYGHISSWNVHVGQEVKQGDVIAKSGNEGISTGPHLHITIREGAKFQGKAVNPAKYINADF